MREGHLGMTNGEEHEGLDGEQGFFSDENVNFVFFQQENGTTLI